MKTKKPPRGFIQVKLHCGLCGSFNLVPKNKTSSLGALQTTRKHGTDICSDICGTRNISCSISIQIHIQSYLCVGTANATTNIHLAGVQINKRCQLSFGFKASPLGRHCEERDNNLGRLDIVCCTSQSLQQFR